jgi:hypothetical protein
MLSPFVALRVNSAKQLTTSLPSERDPSLRLRVTWICLAQGDMDSLIDDNAIGMVSQGIIYRSSISQILDNAKEYGYTD